MAEKMTFLPSFLEPTDEMEDIVQQALFVFGVVRYGVRGVEPSFDDKLMRVSFKLIKPVIDAHKRDRDRKKPTDGKSMENPQPTDGKSMENPRKILETSKDKDKNKDNNIAQTEFALVSESSSKAEKTSRWTFEDFWEQYGKKVDRQKCEKKWAKLSEGDRAAIMAYLPGYVGATPDVKFRRDPATFLNNRTWENDLPCHGQTDGQTMPAPTERQDDFENWLAEQPKGAANA